MSGQPCKTQADANKFRNEYMRHLDNRIEINDMNLTANKNYLLTGQLPAQSQIRDTRTTSEKLKDVETLKQKIASELSSVAEPSVAYAIVSKVMNSPLNVDNTLLRFLAQRAGSIADLFQKNMAYGVIGDENDIERIVEFIKNMYSEMQGKFQSTKSYINSLSTNTASSRVVSSNDIDNIIVGLEDILKNIVILSADVNPSEMKGYAFDLKRYEDRLTELKNMVSILKNVLPSTEQIKILLDDISREGTLEGDQLIGNKYDTKAIKVFFSLMEELPKYSEVMALITKLKQYIRTNNMKVFKDGIVRLGSIFSNVIEKINDGVINDFINIKIALDQKEHSIRRLNEINTVQNIHAMNRQNEQEAKAQRVYIVNPESDAVYIRNPNIISNHINNDSNNQLSNNLFTPSSISTSNMSSQTSSNQEEKSQNPSFNSRPSSNPFVDALMKNKLFNKQINEMGNQSVIESQGTQMDAGTKMMQRNNLSELLNTVLDSDPMVLNEINAKLGTNLTKGRVKGHILKMYDNGDYQIGSLGIKGLGIKRRGRPRGSGIKIKEPIIREPNFVSFGINEINQKKLGRGIVKIRRNTGSNYMDMPSKHVSNNLQNIIKSIIGGSIPNYNDLGKLSDEEKDYLNKLVSRSNLNDRLSVPAPSKDQEEKDIHSFEVMKGQIMSGNDSSELVRKFKLLIRKLSKQGLLPKHDVEELMEILLDLGY